MESLNKKDKWNKRFIGFFIPTAIFFILFIIVFVLYYSFYKHNFRDGFIFIICSFFFVPLLFLFAFNGFVTFIFSLISLIKSSKPRKLRVLGLVLSISSIALTFSGVGIDYALADKAVIGIPDGYLEAFKYENVVKIDSYEISYSYKGGTQDYGKDIDDNVKNAIANIETSKPVVPPIDFEIQVNESLYYVIPFEEYGYIRFTDIGYIEISYNGFLFGPVINIFYTFDIDEFEALETIFKDTILQYNLEKSED